MILRSCRSVVTTSLVSGHQIQPGLFEPLIGLRNVGFTSAPDLELRLFVT